MPVYCPSMRRTETPGQDCRVISGMILAARYLGISWVTVSPPILKARNGRQRHHADTRQPLLPLSHLFWIWAVLFPWEGPMIPGWPSVQYSKSPRFSLPINKVFTRPSDEGLDIFGERLLSGSHHHRRAFSSKNSSIDTHSIHQSPVNYMSKNSISRDWYSIW